MQRKLFIPGVILALVVAATLATVVIATPIGEARITYPYDGTQVSGVLNIDCNAAVTSPNFSFYKVEFGLGENPPGFGAVTEVTKTLPKDNHCATWDTTKWPNGPVFLKLTVVDNTSNYLEDRVRVIINNNGTTVGSSVCKDCHGETHTGWLGTAHAAVGTTCETCHGPGGTHVATGGGLTFMDKTYAAGLCATCHTEVAAEWSESKHAAVPPAAEFGRAVCINCHTAQGFVNVQVGGNKNYPVPYHLEGQTCVTCHDVHSAANPGQLRKVGSVKLPSGDVVNAGLAANCESCHNQRRDVADITNQVMNTFGRGPHEGTSSDMFNGVGAWEFPESGIKFSSSQHKDVVTDACVTCHMKPTVDSKASHTFEPQVAACQNCHGEQVKSFEFQAKGDYDGNGKVETVQHELEGLMALVEAQLPPPPYSNKTLDTPAKRGAAYNVLFVERDRSTGIHNTVYAVQLLQASYRMVTGTDVPNATLLINK